MFRLSLRVLTSNNGGFRNNSPEIIRLSNQWRNYRSEIDPARLHFLAKLLGISQPEAVKLMKQFKGVRKPTEDEVTKSLAICEIHGIDEVIRATAPVVLLFKPATLEQRINFYKDLGCTEVLPHMICSYYSNVHISVETLKEQKLLPADIDVAKNLLNCLDEPPPDVPPVESLPEDRTLAEIHRNILVHYLTWKLELTEAQLDRIMTIKSTLKYPSLSMLRKMVHMLENEFEFSKEKIRRNSYLLFKSPYNTQQILDDIKYIGSMDTKSVILKYPRLLNVQVEKLKEKMRILEEFKVRDEAISKCPDIFTLASKTIYNRFVEFQTMKDLHGHYAHPRFLMLIFYLRGVKRRMEILKKLNVRCVSLHTLCSGDLAFQKFITVGSDRTKGKDLLRFLCYEIGLDFPNNRVDLIKRHPMWCQVPFRLVQESFAYLKERNFTDEDILRNIQIVLYRSPQLEARLKEIDSTIPDESWELTPDKKLALCLYNIEKEYHFDGNGVWNCEPGESSNQTQDSEEQNFISLRHTSNV